jgi:hypothetical protein
MRAKSSADSTLPTLPRRWLGTQRGRHPRPRRISRRLAPSWGYLRAVTRAAAQAQWSAGQTLPGGVRALFEGMPFKSVSGAADLEVSGGSTQRMRFPSRRRDYGFHRYRSGGARERRCPPARRRRRRNTVPIASTSGCSPGDTPILEVSPRRPRNPLAGGLCGTRRALRTTPHISCSTRCGARRIGLGISGGNELRGPPGSMWALAPNKTFPGRALAREPAGNHVSVSAARTLRE